MSIQLTPSDPAHGPSAAMRVKGPDDGAIPLCRHHHIEQHQIGWTLFEEKYQINREKEACTHYVAFLIVSGRLLADQKENA